MQASYRAGSASGSEGGYELGSSGLKLQLFKIIEADCLNWLRCKRNNFYQNDSSYFLHTKHSDLL
jgi:hypothetical protein